MIQARKPYAHIAMIVLGSALSFSALAAGNNSGAQETYRSDAAFCKSGQSQQDYATCMREAGAALQENRRSNLRSDDQQTLAQNAEQRCDAQRGSDKAACQARVEGLGTTEGSVEGGGIIREVVVVTPAGQ